MSLTVEKFRAKLKNRAVRRARSFRRKMLKRSDVWRSAKFRPRLRALQKLVPGGTNLAKAEVLFSETAEYIMSLKRQVFFLQTLTDLYVNSGAAGRMLRSQEHSVAVDKDGHCN
ncbi:hypothetical protein SUGI_0202270 [Cryptomeria japonica]|uniref:uncharacterized protein LOC131068596 n=1 Tax=Cryptomeria japonica TaxID=3369 RepID=UPI002408D2D2|nr:uncharacterized protein LOC131068596 [Cryptomeria japonica]GLJ12987.1 hypothetical protein SUGI_0202270 [Cryptomeria japonica]